MDKKQKNISLSKAPSTFEKILNIVLIVFAVATFSISGVLLYQKRYLSSFWVNGQSMYPTLNKDIVDAHGNRFDEQADELKMNGAKNVDFGVMDEHKSAIKHIKRFDIVVCEYKESDTSNKIKRVLGLPGETIKFDTSYTESRGSLYVKASSGNFDLVEQPIETKYINGANCVYPVGEIVLGEDEYFVAGDNRAHSSDCRTTGNPITRSLITGKVVAIVATCESYVNSDGDLDYKNVNYFKWPRFL